MKFFYTAAATLAVFASAVVAQEDIDDFIPEPCGADAPGPELLQAVDVEASIAALAEGGAINVQTYVHVVTTTAKQGQFTQTMVDRQIDTMNDRFAPAGISFNLADTSFTVNDDWGAPSGQSDAGVTAMKSSLRKGGYGDLNLYFLSDMPGRLLGWCNMPGRVRAGSDLSFDGCINAAATLPGSSMRNYNTGITAVHEVGHWFGAHHVFNGESCSADGDLVADTPLQSTQSGGCPASKDSCPDSPGQDSIHNYMDYTIDSCKNEWSPGQIARMNELYNQFRASDAGTGPAPTPRPTTTAAPVPTSSGVPPVPSSTGSAPAPSAPTTTRTRRPRPTNRPPRPTGQPGRPTTTAAPTVSVSEADTVTTAPATEVTEATSATATVSATTIVTVPANPGNGTLPTIPTPSGNGTAPRPTNTGIRPPRPRPTGRPRVSRWRLLLEAIVKDMSDYEG